MGGVRMSTYKKEMGSKLDYYAMHFVSKKRNCHKGGNALLQLEQQKQKDPTKMITWKDLQPILDVLYEIQKEDSEIFVELQRRIEKITPYTRDKVRKKANNQKHFNRFYGKKKGGE